MYSPYSAFDNNPVYYSDPSGANSITSDPQYDYGDPYQGWALDGAPQTASQRIFGSERFGTSAYFADAFGESWTNPKKYSVSAGDLTNPWVQYFASEANRIGGVLAGLENSTNSAAGAYTNGVKSAYSDFFDLGSLKNSISKTWNDPWGSWKNKMGASGGWKNFIPGYALYKMGWGRVFSLTGDTVNAVSNAMNGNYYQAGQINGYNSAQGTFELGLTLATAGISRGLSNIRPISFSGWKGIGIGNAELTFGYRLRTGIGLSYRVTKNNITLARDFHTIGGKFQHHYHYIEAGKFTKGHLSPSLLKQNGYRFNDLWQGLPEVRWKKSPLWRALEDSSF